MTQIEDLVRQALAETPVTTDTTDPLGALDRRVRRARRRLAAGAGVALAAVVVAVAVPLATLHRGTTGGSTTLGPGPSPTSSIAGSPPQWARSAHGVATGDFANWIVADKGNHGRRELVELDEHHQVAGRFPVPDSALFVAERSGIAWVWGGGDGAYPDAQVTAVDVHTGRAGTLTFPGTSISDLVVDERGDAWAVGVDSVRQLHLDAGKPVVLATIPVTGAQRIVGTSTGDFWVQADTQLVQLLPTGSRGARVGVRTHWVGALLAAGDQDNVWIQASDRVVGLLDPQQHAQGVSGSLSYQVEVPGRPTAVAVDPAGGLYVAWSPGRAGKGGIAYFNRAAVRNAGPPTSFTQGANVDVETMTVDVGGGLVWQNVDGSLSTWDPQSS